MPLTLPKHAQADILASQRYLSTELDDGLGDIQANHFLFDILKEIGPFAYNRGVEDAKASSPPNSKTSPAPALPKP